MNERLKIVATGGNGFVGSFVFREPFFEEGSVLKPSRNELDITDIDNVSRFIYDNKIEFVIHGAAYTNVQKAKLDYLVAKSINGDGTGNVARACEKAKIPMVLISTDMVFPGRRNKSDGLYREDERRPESFTSTSLGSYASTKLLAEQVAQDNSSKLSIVRISYPFGSAYPGKDYVSKLVSRIQSGGSVFSDQIITPTFLPDLAISLKEILNRNLNGIFHVVTDSTTPFEMASYLVNRFKLPYVVNEGFCSDYLRNLNTEPIPKYGGLDTEKTRETLGINFHSWKKALNIMLS